MMGAIVLGPRIGKFAKDGSPRAIPGHSIPFVVLGAMILGSAIIIHSDMPPHYKNVPVLGVVAFVIAAIFAFRLLYAIMKHGRM